MTLKTKKTIIISFAAAIVLALLGFLTIKFVMTKTPAETVEKVLEVKSKNGFENEMKRYFDQKFLDIPKISTEKSVAVAHSLTQTGDTGEVKVVFNVISATAEGSASVPVAEFYLKRANSFPNFWQITRAVELNPQFSKSIADILPVKIADRAVFNDEIGFSPGLKLKLSDFKTISAAGDIPASFNFNITALGPNLTEFAGEPIYFQIMSANKACSGFEKYSFKVPSKAENISIFSTVSVCKPDSVYVFIKDSNNLAVALK